MKLTGKAKEDFENWKLELYNKWVNEITPENIYYGYSQFNDLPKSMQYGVYVDWFDTVDITIGRGSDKKYFVQPNSTVNWYRSENFKLSREEVILKSNKIYNERT